MGDLFLIDPRCELTKTICATFEESGYTTRVYDGEVTDDALREAKGFTAVCIFVNKKILPSQVPILVDNGNKLILHCSAGYDNAPWEELKAAGIAVYRVPSYSPASIAEFAITNILALAKNVEKSFVMTKMADFEIEPLQCILLETRICGVIGTGLIGKITAKKISALVDKVLCYDVYPDHEWIKTVPNAEYVDIKTILSQSHFLTVHVPLLPTTHHLINKEAFDLMKQDVIIVNTSRGEIVQLSALIDALNSGKVFGVALDVFEGEKKFIFKDMTKKGFKDHPELAKLVTFDNVVLSSHIAFYTDQAVEQITAKTLHNYNSFLGKEDKDKRAKVC